VEEFTADEIMVACIARQIRDGEVVVQGLATPLVACGFLLARHTHAPNLYFASAIGQSICREPAPVSLLNVESLWLDRSLTNVGFVQVATEILPTLRPKEFFRPGQIDPHGNFNNIAFGKEYLSGGRPRMRLPGSGGIPDVTTFIHDIHLYVPRHSRVTFVADLDVRSGLGYAPERTRGQGPVYLVTDLGQFDFAGGRMRLTSYHPGVRVEHIQAKTGFDLEISPKVTETPRPSPEELKLLREQIDPLMIRRLETMSGNQRRQLLHEIIASESRVLAGNRH
jgi:acyl CoA:acetate/3-ketoacid CoA transferase beta subunit